MVQLPGDDRDSVVLNSFPFPRKKWKLHSKGFAQGSMLPPIQVLSDDEVEPTHLVATSPSASSNIVATAKRRPAKRRTQNVVALEPPPGPDLQCLRRRVQSSCGCLCGCFQSFRSSAQFARLVKLRTTISQLEKVEQDKYVCSSDLMALYITC